MVCSVCKMEVCLNFAVKILHQPKWFAYVIFLYHPHKNAGLSQKGMNPIVGLN